MSTIEATGFDFGLYMCGGCGHATGTRLYIYINRPNEPGAKACARGAWKTHTRARARTRAHTLHTTKHYTHTRAFNGRAVS